MSLLGLDIGSTGTKGIVFREDGKVISSAYREYDMLFPQAGWVEINAEEMWGKVLDLIKELNNTTSGDPITALSVSTFGEAFTPIDEKGRILFNTIYPLDSRCTDELNEIIEDFGEDFLYETTALIPSYLYSLSKLLWMKKNVPDIYHKTDKFLFSEDMLFRQLGLVDTKVSYSLSSRTMFFDIKAKKWSTKILDKYDIDIKRFSIPAPPGTVVGEIPNSVKEELGFKKQVMLVTGGHDQTCATLGAGSIRKGSAADGIGTVECIIPVFDEIIINKKMKKNMFCCEPSAIKDLYVTLAYNMTAGSILKWYRNTIGFMDEVKSKQENRDFYDYIFSQLDYKPTKIYAFPYFGASGTPYFYPHALGALLGLSLDTRNKDIIQSIIESLIFEIKFNLDLLEESGVAIHELRATGGGAKSDYWLQLKCNVLGKPIYRMEVEEAGCLATMILAGVGTSVYTSYDDAVHQFVKIKKDFHPRNDNVDLYLTKYEKYKKLFELMKSYLYED